MAEIKPKMVDGEPVCNRLCPSATWYDGGNNSIFSLLIGCKRAGQTIMAATETNIICIPGLRQQRDEARGLLRHADKLANIAETKMNAMAKDLIPTLPVKWKDGIDLDPDIEDVFKRYLHIGGE